MKKFLFIIILTLLSFSCFSSEVKQECDHDWKLEKIVNGERYWVCSECGKQYKAYNKIKPVVNTPYSTPVIILLAIIYVTLCSILLTCKNKNYNKERHCRNTVYYLLPFSTILCVTIKRFWEQWWAIGIIYSLILSLLASMIGLLISSIVNIARAKSYNIPDDDKRVQNERDKRTSGLFAALLGAFYIVHKTKNSVKDIANVDGWKEMK